MSEQELIIDGIYKHNLSGIRYKLVKEKWDATNYEAAGKLERYVDYVQLDDGKLPAGTEYGRDKQNFLNNFTYIPEE